MTLPIIYYCSVEEEAFEAAALIIILRLWRVVRIVNGAVLSSKAQSDRQLEEARSEARRIIHAFHKCQDKLDAVEVKIIISYICIELARGW